MSTYLQKSDGIGFQKVGFISRLMNLVLSRPKPGELPVSTSTEEQELLENLKSARKEWVNACMDFEYADDQDIVDYYTYKIKAGQLRYEYFLRKAKQKGLKVGLMDSLDTPQEMSRVSL